MRRRSVTYRRRVVAAGAGSGSVTPSARDAAFDALADPTRRAVLDLLRTGRRPAGDIARSFPVSRPAISKHLGILRRAHLVEERREGRNRIYQINPEPLKAVDSWLEQYRNFWTASLNNLKTFVEAEYAKEIRASNSSQSKIGDPSAEKS